MQNLRQSAFHVTWQNQSFSTTAFSTTGQARIATSGVAFSDVGAVKNRENVSFGSFDVKAAGVLMNGPADTEDIGRTVYHVKAYVSILLDQGRTHFFAGAAPSAPTGSPTGEVIQEEIRFMNNEQTLVFEEYFAADLFQAFPQRLICFGVGVQSETTVSNIPCAMMLSVQRLTRPGPPIVYQAAS